jgi:mannose-6-phosphate isomerase-like protein (cupin superfamily)
MSLREQEREAAKILETLSLEVLGDRLRRARLRQGRSIRELASAAALSKTSIVRLEQGGVTYPITVVKVCAALGLHLASLANPSGEGNSDTVAVHRHSDDRWFDLTDFGVGPLGGLDRPLTPQERAQFIQAGEGNRGVPLLILKSRLPEGRLLSTVIEVFALSEPRSHPGEEFVFVLEGSAQLTVGAETFLLEQGESIVFRSAEPHAYAPNPALPEQALPVRLLSVRLDDRPAKAGRVTSK